MRKKWRMNQGSAYEMKISSRKDVRVSGHGLKIPVDAPDYAGFAAMMQTRERILKQFSQIKSIADLEGVTRVKNKFDHLFFTRLFVPERHK